MRRLGLILLLTIILTGCQGDNATPASGSYASYPASSSSPYYPLLKGLEGRLVMIEYLSALRGACPLEDSTAPGEIVLGSTLSNKDDCMMRQARISTGMLGAPEAACPEVILAEFLRCVFYVSSAARMITAAGSNSDEVMNWSEPEASLHVGFGLLATRARLNCGDAGMTSCVTREMGTMLLLSATVIDSCVQQGIPQTQATCIAMELLFDQIQSALLYVG